MAENFPSTTWPQISLFFISFLKLCSGSVALVFLISSAFEANKHLKQSIPFIMTMMMKSLFLLFVMLMCASGFVAPAQRTGHPFIVADSSALFLHPSQAKDLEEFAYKFMQEAAQRCSTADTDKNNQANGCKQRNGPVAWCRRVILNWKQA
jgi:hypothetical protein